MIRTTQFRLFLAITLALSIYAWLQSGYWYTQVTKVRAAIYKASHSQVTLDDLQAQIQSLQSENERLRSLLKLPRQGWKLSLTAATLYRSDLDLWMNRGSADGVSLRCVALHSGGLVGRVVEVQPHQCRVRPSLHADSQVPVLLGNLQGIAHGRRWQLEVDEVRSRPPVETGTIVTTSGLGQIYPASILVGRVCRKLSSNEPMFARYEVEPSVFLDEVLEVLLVERQS